MFGVCGHIRCQQPLDVHLGAAHGSLGPQCAAYLDGDLGRREFAAKPGPHVLHNGGDVARYIAEFVDAVDEDSNTLLVQTA